MDGGVIMDETDQQPPVSRAWDDRATEIIAEASQDAAGITAQRCPDRSRALARGRRDGAMVVKKVTVRLTAVVFDEARSAITIIRLSFIC